MTKYDLWETPQKKVVYIMRNTFYILRFIITKNFLRVHLVTSSFVIYFTMLKVTFPLILYVIVRLFVRYNTPIQGFDYS